MEITLGETRYIPFLTVNSSNVPVQPTGDALTFAVYEDGTLMGYTPTQSNPATGRFFAIVQASTANGFENDKSYTVVAVATINGSNYEASRDFVVRAYDVGDIPAATAGLLTAQDITFTTPYIEGVMTLYKGVEYSIANGNSTPFPFTNLPNLTSGLAKVHIFASKGLPIIDQALVITNAGTATQTITFTMTSTNTAILDPPHSYTATILYKTATASDYSVAVEFPVQTRRA